MPCRTDPDLRPSLSFPRHRGTGGRPAKRESRLTQQAERLRAERDKAIRVAYRDGLPMRTIAKVLRISHQRVSQVVRS